MPDNPNTQSESGPLDAEDWEIAFEPYKDDPLSAFTLACHLTELKRYVNSLKMNEAAEAIDRAIDCLYEHSEFRRASRELFLIAIEGELTTDREALLRQLGIRI